MRGGILWIFVCVVVALSLQEANAYVKPYGKTRRLIDYANKNGPYLGLVIPNQFELNPLLQHPSFNASSLIIDVAGRRFRFGTIQNKKVILVMTGLGMVWQNLSIKVLSYAFFLNGHDRFPNPFSCLSIVTYNCKVNAGITTQLLLSLFNINSVVHYGIAGNANPSLHVADVAIPKYWAHLGLWNWQRYGDGPEDQLALETNGDYTRSIGYLKFANYTKDCTKADNLLNNIWYQPEEIFPVNGTPEEREHAFWVPVDPRFYELSKKLEGMKLVGCVNETLCLSETPKVARVERGASASIFLDNAAYRSFIYDKFQVSPVEMESAAVALICYQQKIPHITIRAISDLAGGGGSAQSNEADTFTSLAATNSVEVVIEFVRYLP